MDSHSFLNAQHSANPVFASLFGHAHMLISRQDMYDMIKNMLWWIDNGIIMAGLSMVFFRNPLFWSKGNLHKLPAVIWQYSYRGETAFLQRAPPLFWSFSDGILLLVFNYQITDTRMTNGERATLSSIFCVLILVDEGLLRRFTMFNGGFSKGQLDWLDSVLSSADEKRERVTIVCKWSLSLSQSLE